MSNWHWNVVNTGKWHRNGFKKFPDDFGPTVYGLYLFGFGFIWFWTNAQSR